MNEEAFREIEDLGILKRFQADLKLLTGLGFDFIDTQAKHSLPLNAIKKYTPFCSLVHTKPLGRTACEESTLKAVAQCLKTKQPVMSNCHLGLVDVYIPLIIHNTVTGVLTTGQFLFSKPDAPGFNRIKKRMAGFGLNLSRAKADYLSIPVIKKERVKAIVDLINVVIEYIREAEHKILVAGDVTRKDKLRQAREFIESKYTQDISLADAASAVNLSPSRLSHLMKERLNTNFTAYLNDLRVHWAKFFLTNTNLKIIEVASRVGFGNLSHFNHLFKEKVGLSPLRFRKQQNSTRI
ncbi:MAG: PocR ligand-binding domain-containing protein [Candidatus Omnitrophota bacterium]